MKPTSPFLAGLTDPRIKRNQLHKFEEIMFIALAAILCGAETWNAIAAYGKSKEKWLKTFLELENGIPSHDTFNRTFAALDPIEFEAWFIRLICKMVIKLDKEVVAVDGKTMRGASQSKSQKKVHMVSAWANANQLILGQRKVDDKSNEITAIPELLKVLFIEGCVVTIDAMGCQKAIAECIVDKGADYILAVKGNQKELYEQLQDSFKMLPKPGIDETINIGHGRIERRRCYAITDLSLVTRRQDWKKLTSLVLVQTERTNKSTNVTEREERYYISSLSQAEKEFNGQIRGHWGIENTLHWVLDVAFGEDKSRKRQRNAAENYSILIRLALTLLRREKSTQASIKEKRLRAGWDDDYLLKILLQWNN